MHQRWLRSGPAYEFLYKTAGIPRLIIPIVSRMLRKAAHAQGTGRHTEKEMDHMQEQDLRALSQFLGMHI